MSALTACSSRSVEAALDLILQKRSPGEGGGGGGGKKLSAIQEDDVALASPMARAPCPPRPHRDTAGGLRADWERAKTHESPKVYHTGPIDFRRMSPITLPGFSTPISFAEELLHVPSLRNPPSYPSSTAAAPSKGSWDEEASPTRTSPPNFTASPPPYDTSKTHIHVSPPPDLHPQSYSPFSAPLPLPSRQRASPVYYKHSTVTPPAAEFSDSGIEEEATPHRNPVPCEAFKFYMEQHIENVLKAHTQRQQRRMKLEVEMARRGMDEATSEQMRRLLYQKESNFLRMKRAKMRQDMFEVVKPLGVGAFGIVSLVRKVDSKKLYAMKTLHKADVLKRNQVAHVKAERDILAEADNEWVVKLFFSFQDTENLYFVMEYIPGGDMMSLLIKLGTFPEHLTLFYIAELVCAIESVHRMGFIHRDIKPDNILIGADGHIKLTDFGLCTGFRWTHDSRRYQPKGSHSRQYSMEPVPFEQGAKEPLKTLEIRRIRERDRCVAHSLVGTPNYIAPEILRRVGYTQLCDWWSVGVIMYEMLVGQPPFMAPTPSETQVKIINWPQYLHLPRGAAMSPAAADLILQFCCDPQDRIGRNGADEIKQHAFFNIDWSVGIRNYEPPYYPKVMYDADTSNFDPIPQSQLQRLYSKQQQQVSLPKGTPEHAFYEFTFIRFCPERGAGQRKPTVTAYSGPSSSSSSQDKRGSSSAANSSPSSKEKRSCKTTAQPVYV